MNAVFVENPAHHFGAPQSDNSSYISASPSTTIVHCDFSGGQINSDAGLLPVRAFDERRHLTRDWVQLLSDARDDERLRHHSLVLWRQCIYQIVAGYEDANDADRLRHDPTLQIVADRQPVSPAAAPARRGARRKSRLCVQGCSKSVPV